MNGRDSLANPTIDEGGRDPDAPPSFPLMGGPQVAASSPVPVALVAPSPRPAGPSVGNATAASSSTRSNGSAGLMPPPTSSGPSLSVPRAQGGSLMPPPRTTAAAPHRLAPATSGGGLLAPSTPKLKRSKVALAPGFGPLDWARLKSSGKPELRAGLSQLQRITRDELAKHNQPEDAWSAFHGKVYNLTPYLRYHPGGVDELMRVAGRDGTRLFMLTHSWVNIEAMIDTTMVGFLVPG